jgi:DNA-directed RNA polymerase specialized sigma24 family protein
MTWDELFELLGPIHDDVQLFARRIARSAAEGDDVFQEAVLRAAKNLGSLRDRSRFKPWMYSVVVSVHRSRRRSPFWTRWISSEPPDLVPRHRGSDRFRRRA